VDAVIRSSRTFNGKAGRSVYDRQCEPQQPSRSGFSMGFSAAKNFPLLRMRSCSSAADIFNILNHPNFAGPDEASALLFPAASGSTPASLHNQRKFRQSWANGRRFEQ